MAEIMEEDKVTIKEEISTVEDTCTVYVVGEDIKEEITENQGICKHFIYIYIKFFSFFKSSNLKNITEKIYNIV